MKIRLHDRDSGERQEIETTGVTAHEVGEEMAKVFAEIFDRSFEFTERNDGRILEVRDQDSGQEWMTIRDISIVLGKTKKAVYKLFDRQAKKTAAILGVEPLPIRKIPGSREYGALRSEFFDWLRQTPQPVKLDRPKRGRPRKPGIGGSVGK